MTKNPAARLGLSLAATLVLGLTACSGSNHKSATTTTLPSQPAAAGAAASAQSNTAAQTAATSGPTGHDDALQTALQQAALTQSDVPAGWTASLTMDQVPTTPGGYTAVYAALFSKDGTGAGMATGSSQAMVTLTGYADAKAATSMFSSGSQKMSVQVPGGDKVSVNQVNLKLGDATETAETSSPMGDLDEVIWRRGRVLVTVTLTLPGGTGASGMNEAVAIAKAQDAKLAAAGL